MKTLVVAALILFATPESKAGDVDFSLGFSYQRKGLRVGVGVQKQGPREDLRVGVGVRSKQGPRQGLQVGVAVHRGHRHGHCCRWVPAHYDDVRSRVWVPGHYQPVRHRALAHRRSRKRPAHAAQLCGFPPRHARHRRLARHRRWVPGHYEWRVERVLRPGHWECRHRHH
ncbi:MAG: hypothetical protein ACYSX0_10760 [Planctomycetota bacterium]